MADGLNMIDAGNLIGVALGSLLTLATGWVQHLYQRQDKALDQAKERSKLLREKAEIIYQHMDALTQNSTIATINALREIPSGEKLESPSNLEVHSRLKALLAIYFSSSAPIVQRYVARSEKEMAPILAKMASAATGKPSSEVDVRALKAEMFAVGNVITGTFVEELRTFMDAEVQKLI